MSKEFNAGDIIGKTLFARTSVAIKKLPLDDSKPFKKIKSGNKIGEVYSYLNPKAGSRENLYWQFINPDGSFFYAEHQEGRFDTESLRHQGVKTLEEKEKEIEEGKKDLTSRVTGFLQSVIKYILIAWVVTEIVNVLLIKKAKADK